MLFALLFLSMLLNTTKKKSRTARGMVRLNSKAELDLRTTSDGQEKEETFHTRSYHSATHIRSYRHSYPDGPIGNYPGL